jgi:hypothetical protein
MDIKLGANSNLIFQKIKDNDTGNKTEKLSEINNVKINSSLRDKIKLDLFSSEIDNKFFKDKIININKSLSNFEDEFSKLQFVEQKLDEITSFTDKNNLKKAQAVIDTGLYNDSNILKEYFSSDNIKADLPAARTAIEDKYSQLNREYKAIEITSQNVMSLYSYPLPISDINTTDIDINSLNSSTKLNTKKVIDLI